MKRITVLLLLLVGVLACPGQALAEEQIGLSDVIAALERPFGAAAGREGGGAATAIADFQGEFFQESRLASLERVQRGRGRVWVKFARTGGDRVPQAMFRWEYEQPTNQEIVSDGETLWVYLPENRQVIRSDIEFTSRARPDDPMTFLTGLGNLSRDFQISWASPNHDVEGNYVLELRPRRASTMIQRLVMVVDRDAVLDFTRHGRTGNIFPILSTTVMDPNGNTTIIEFSDIRLNRGLSASRFNFIVPAGVEVVRPTGSEMGF